MAIDVKAKAINDAAKEVVSAVRPIRDLSAKIITPIAEGVEIHADTVASLKSKAGGMRATWVSARDALDAAFAL